MMSNSRLGHGREVREGVGGVLEVGEREHAEGAEAAAARRMRRRRRRRRLLAGAIVGPRIAGIGIVGPRGAPRADARPVLPAASSVGRFGSRPGIASRCARREPQRIDVWSDV